MVIVHLSGGFGNQMFSYAFGYAVAKAKGEELAIDTAIQDAPWFFRNPDILKMNIKYAKRITYPIGRKIWERGFFNKIAFKKAIGWNTQVITESDLVKQDFPIFYCNQIKGDIYLKGNWGNETWFREAAEEIKDMYVFRDSLSEAAQKLFNQIEQCPTSVTVHIRRGDYVNIGIAMEASYFMQAMKEIAERVENPVFYCFSEDLEWAKQAFAEVPYEVIYAEYESEDKGIEDFRLLSAGKHQIISNSSYSWWAAYLNRNPQKCVVIPCDEQTMWNKEFMVDGWIPTPFTVNGKAE